MKPIFIHGHAGPNPWKIALILEELSIPYETKIYATEDLKKPPFITTLNPNGFTPVIEDPNRDFKLWESGAIIEYLLDNYDTKHLISFPSSSIKERALATQYSFFQATFQGPNISNGFYFTRNPNPEARKRFVGESIRLLGVLEVELENKEWLVGGKLSAADLAFLPYTWSMSLTLGQDNPDLAKDFPKVDAWLQRMGTRPSVKKVISDRAAILAATAAAAKGQQKT